jgi:hypothetical protein
MALVGISMCVKCKVTATAAHMRAFGATIKPEEDRGQVVHDYDFMRGR